MKNKMLTTGIIVLSSLTFIISFGSFNSQTARDVSAFNCQEDFGNSCIDDQNKPRCKSSYTESCGDGCTRSVSCGGNGEFRTGACNCKEEKPTCPVATIWDGKKCKGTAKGTDDATKDQDPEEDGGEKVAKKDKKKGDPKTRQEANNAVDVGNTDGGGATGGSGTESEDSLTSDVDIALDLLFNNNPENSTTIPYESFDKGSICGSNLNLNTSKFNETSNTGKFFCTNDQDTFMVASCIEGVCVVRNDVDAIIQNIVPPEMSLEVAITTVDLTPAQTEFSETQRPESKCEIDSESAVQALQLTRVVEEICSYEYLYIPTGGGKASKQEFSLRCDDASRENLSSKYSCPNEFPEGNLINNDNSIFKKVSAQAIPTPREFDLNSLSSGEYSIQINNFDKASIEVYSDQVSIEYFWDINGDNVKQDDEPQLYPQKNFATISKTKELVTQKYQLGWNLVTFSFISDAIKDAKTLLTHLGSQGVAGIQISRYRNGLWENYVLRISDENTIVEFGDNFKIIPGEGYFIRSLNTGISTFEGNPFTSSVPINMTPGWNLIGVQAPANDYNAESFLNICKNQGALCSTISKYFNGRYESYVEDEGTFFGNNFDLLSNEGYFVLNTGEDKVITP